MLFIHICFAIISVASFMTRIVLSEVRPEKLQQKFFKIAPHIIDTLLLLSGAILLILGNWLEGNYVWVVSKFLVLVVYIVLGIVAMRNQGIKRYFAFSAALACYFYIIQIATTKQGFLSF